MAKRKNYAAPGRAGHRRQSAQNKCLNREPLSGWPRTLLAKVKPTTQALAVFAKTGESLGCIGVKRGPVRPVSKPALIKWTGSLGSRSCTDLPCLDGRKDCAGTAGVSAASHLEFGVNKLVNHVSRHDVGTVPHQPACL